MESVKKVYNSRNLAKDRQKLSHAVVTTLEETDTQHNGEIDQKKGFRDSLALFDGDPWADLFEFRQKYPQSTLLLWLASS